MNRLSLSMFWRALIVHFAISIFIFAALAGVQDPIGWTFLKLKPTVFHGAIGVVLFGSLRITRYGLLHFLWGGNLRQPLEFWRKFTFWLAVLLVALAVANLIVAYAASISTWITYKTFAPLVALLGYCFVGVRMSRSARPVADQGANNAEA